MSFIKKFHRLLARKRGVFTQCLLSILVLLVSGLGKAQVLEPFSIEDSTHHPNCGYSADMQKSVSSSPLITTDFPPNARVDCGRISFYFEDLLPSNPAVGFGDATLGSIRRTTLCEVANQIQSIFDFTNVDLNNPLRIIVEKSFAALPVASNAPSGISWHAQASPFYNPSATSTILNGYFNDYVTSGVDPINMVEFHGRLKLNFHEISPTSNPIPIDYHSEHNTPVPNCKIDLYSTLLHQMGHIMGWISYVSFTPLGGTSYIPSSNANNVYSSLDNSIHVGQLYHPFSTSALQKLINSNTLNASLIAISNYWVSNEPAPENLPVFSGVNATPPPIGVPHYNIISHLDDRRLAYSYRQRISPGDYQDFVMSPYALAGVERRDFTKGELKKFNSILGYNFVNPVSTIVTNHLPFCSKMSTSGYNSTYLSYAAPNYFDAAEYLPIDFPNFINTGATLPILLSNDNTLLDADNDPLYVYPGSVFNFRGCGNGGNNHDQLVPIYSGTNIVGFNYTPRPNFVGKAQFGFNLFDGKEKGGFVVYTIDVKRGPNVSCPQGSNLVLNGSFEEGSEVKRKGVDETIPNATIWMNGFREGALGSVHFSDCNPHCWQMYPSYFGGAGTIIKDAHANCVDATILKEEFGSGVNAMPGISGAPTPLSSMHERFAIIRGTGAGFFNLCSDITYCKRYSLRFDAALKGQPAAPVSFQIGFTDDNTLASQSINIASLANVTWLNWSTSSTFNLTNSWQTYEYSFYYCGNDPSNVLFLKNTSTSSAFIDNIVLVESPPVISITQANVTNTPTCTDVQLEVLGVPGNSCGNITYSWAPSNGLSCVNCPNPIATVPTPTVYTVTVSTGCEVLTATTTVYTDEGWEPNINTTNFCKVPNVLSATPVDPSLQYFWSGPGVNATTASVTIAQSGTYNLTITTPGGCSKSASIEMGSSNGDCCAPTIENDPLTVFVSNDPTVNNGSASALTSVFQAPYLSIIGGVVNISNYPGHILINGTFTVDQSLTFNNCPNVVFHKNALVEVPSNRTLTINPGTELRAACNEMWLGIHSIGNGPVVINGATLKDMNTGVKMTVGAPLYCTNTIFSNNNIGIHLNHTTQASNTIIKGNSFSGTNLLSPYANQLGKAGVLITDSRYAVVGDQNTPTLGNSFSNLKTGIHISIEYATGSGQSNYYLYNNNFTNISGSLYGYPTTNNSTPSLYTDAAGSAIYAWRKTGHPVTGKIWVHNTQNSPAQIVNCDKGILASGFSADILRTKVSNATWGFAFGDINSCSYSLHSNTMINNYYGMQFGSGIPAFGDIFNNTYSSSTFHNYMFNYSVLLRYPIGLSLSVYSPTTSPFTIRHNVYSMNAPAGVGINLLNTGLGTILQENIVALTTNTANVSGDPALHGVSLVNCFGTTVRGTTVTGTVATRNNSRTNTSGIYISKSPKLTLECNNTTMTKYGFMTISNSATNPDLVRGNKFKDHIYGMLFRWNGSEGTLGDIGSDTFNPFNAFNSSSPVYNYAGGYRLYQISTCPQSFLHAIYSTVLNPSHIGGPQCKYLSQLTYGGNFNNCPVITYPPTPEEVNTITDIRFAEMVARDSIVYAAYQEVSSWIAAQRLYYELYFDENARNSSAILDSFYQAVQNAPIGEIFEVEESLQGAGDTAFVNDSLLYVDWLNNLEDLILDQSGAEAHEENERTVDLLYVKLLREGYQSFTQEDSLTIAELANRCPFAGGLAVYKARVLFELFEPHQSYNDIEICNHTGYNKGGKGLFDDENNFLASQDGRDYSRIPTIRIYPNPANDMVHIEYAEPGILELIDLTGRVYRSIRLEELMGSYTVDIRDAIPGLYIYRWLVDGQPKENGKLMIGR